MDFHPQRFFFSHGIPYVEIVIELHVLRFDSQVAVIWFLNAYSSILFWYIFWTNSNRSKIDQKFEVVVESKFLLFTLQLKHLI